MTVNNQSGGSNGDRPLQPNITTEQALWLNEVCSQYIPYIANNGKNISWHDAEEIVSNLKCVLISRGFEDLFSEKIRLDIKRGEYPSPEKTRPLLNFHLKRRIADYFRNKNRIKRGYEKQKCNCKVSDCICECRTSGSHRVVEASDHVVELISDKTAELAFNGVLAKSDLDFICDKAWPSLNEIDRIILTAARRNPAGGFNRSSLYEAMTELERDLFLAEYVPTSCKKEAIKRAIASRTGELRRTLRRSVAEEIDDFTCYGA